MDIHNVNTIIIHPRLYKVDGVCYFDDDVISQGEFDELATHYESVVEALAEPWRSRNDDYDMTGRFNAGGQREHEDRI